MAKRKRFTAKPPPRPMQSIFANLGRTWVLRILWASLGLVLLGMALGILLLGTPPPPDPLPRRSFAFWEVALIFLGWFAITSFTFLAWQLAMHEVRAWGKKPIRILWNSGLVLVNVLVILLVVEVFGLRLSGQDWSSLGFRQLTWGWILASLALGLISMVLSGAVAALVMWMLEPQWVNKQENFLLPEEHSTATPPETPASGTRAKLSIPGALAMALLVGVAVPIVEEILFRGVLYAWMSEWMPWMLAAVLSSLAFGLAHFDSGRPVVAACALAGMFMAVAFHYSHSLYAPILIHAVNNLTKVLLTYLLRS